MKIKSSIVSSFMLIGLCLCLWGCVTTSYQGYTGPQLPQEQVATIRFGRAIDTVALWVLSIDGQAIKWHPDTPAKTNKVFLLPGDHTIVFDGSMGARITEPIPMKIHVEAGRQYRFYYNFPGIGFGEE